MIFTKTLQTLGLIPTNSFQGELTQARNNNNFEAIIYFTEQQRISLFHRKVTHPLCLTIEYAAIILFSELTASFRLNPLLDVTVMILPAVIWTFMTFEACRLYCHIIHLPRQPRLQLAAPAA